MAECKVSKAIKVVLYLNEDEALFLKGLCQNSLEALMDSVASVIPAKESEHNRAIREGIFEALFKAGI